MWKPQGGNKKRLTISADGAAWYAGWGGDVVRWGLFGHQSHHTAVWHLREETCKHEREHTGIVLCWFPYFNLKRVWVSEVMSGLSWKIPWALHIPNHSTTHNPPCHIWAPCCSQPQPCGFFQQSAVLLLHDGCTHHHRQCLPFNTH